MVFVFFPFTLFYRSQIHSTNYKSGGITRNDSFTLRGIAAVFIMFSHYVALLDDNSLKTLGPAKLLEWFGGLGVCVFFFLSGYGLWTAYHNKSISTIFLWNRFKSIIPTFIILRLVLDIPLLIRKENINISYIFLYLLGFKKPLWFVSEILIIYFLFFIAFKFFKINHFYMITLLLIFMSFFFMALGYEDRWYNANLIFSFGMFYAIYCDKIQKKLKQKFYLCFFYLGLVFAVNSIIYALFKGFLWANLLKLFAGSAFCMLFICTNMKVEWNSNIFYKLGQKSLHLYIIHPSIWAIISVFYLQNDACKFLICTTISLLTTFLFGYWEDNLKKHFSSIKKGSN